GIQKTLKLLCVHRLNCSRQLVIDPYTRVRYSEFYVELEGLMVLHILRALFVLLMAAAGWFFFIVDPVNARIGDPLIALFITLAIAVFFVCIDILAPRQKVLVFSGTFLGLLVGMLISYGLSFVVYLIIDLFFPGMPAEQKAKVIKFTTLIVGILCCYLSISF